MTAGRIHRNHLDEQIAEHSRDTSDRSVASALASCCWPVLTYRYSLKARAPMPGQTSWPVKSPAGDGLCSLRRQGRGELAVFSSLVPASWGASTLISACIGTMNGSKQTDSSPCPSPLRKGREGYRAFGAGGSWEATALTSARIAALSLGVGELPTLPDA